MFNQLFKKQNPCKAGGPDAASSHTLKHCADQLSPVFTDIFNTSLVECFVHAYFKACRWITDFLTDRKQYVRLGKLVSEPWSVSTGALQRCVLFPLLFLLYTNSLISSHPYAKLLKLADDTTLTGLISNEDESAYREAGDYLAHWCSQNNLVLNSQKTEEMVVDFRRNPASTTPLIMCDSAANSVESFRYQGTIIS